MTVERILGADTGGTALKFVLADRFGAVSRRAEVPTDPGDPGRSLARLAAAVHQVLADDGGGRLVAVGLACAGIVDPVGGRLGRSPNLPGWQDSDLAGALGAAFPGLPQALANDVNAALYGEFRAGAGRGCRDLVMIALGTGVGGGVLLDGRLRVGAHHGAGEIGHMVLDPQGPLCACGTRGCLEAWAGSTGLLRRTREAAAAPAAAGSALAELVARRGAALETRDLAVLAAGGDAAARGIFREAGDRLGQAVGNLINVLDPERVIIGGGVAQAGDLILEPCRRTAARLVLGADAAATPVVAAELGPHAAAVGAAWLALETETAG